MAPPARVVVIDEAQRNRLEAVVRARTAPVRDVQRAQIVLGAADGMSNTAIARALSICQNTVRTWRARFAAHAMAGLGDLPRPGRPAVYGPDVHLRIVSAVTSERPEVDSQWSHRLLAEHLGDDGISPSQIGRILADLDLKPHRVRGWLTRRDDPDFFARAAEVCDQYLRPPAGSIVICIDEKTAIGARHRKHPEQPARPGRVARREFEYVRHGTVSIMAALSVHTGQQVVTERITRNAFATFIGFLTRLDVRIDAALTIDLVRDNGFSPTSRATKEWLHEHPRIQVHRTPPHATWLDQAGLFFSTRRLLRRGTFTSCDHLAFNQPRGLFLST
jgi:transposase